MISPAPRSESLLDFVGREAEEARLTEILTGVAVRGLQVVRVEGEPGIGKTRLLEELRRHADSLGHASLLGTAVELERSLAFHPFIEALGVRGSHPDPLRKGLDDLLFGEQSTLDPQQLLLQAMEKFLELLEELSAERPLLLCLDDLQWADDATLALIRRMTRRLSYAAITLVVAQRPAPTSGALAGLYSNMPRGVLSEIVLTPLSPSAVRALATDRLGADPSAEIERELARANGNPFFVLELLSVLSQQNLPKPKRESNDAGRRSALESTILNHVDSLGPATAQLIRVGAVLGPAFSVQELAAASGRSPADLIAPLDEAARAGLLDQGEAEIQFRHDLVRETVYATLPPAVRQALHLEAGRALAAAGASAVKVAVHMQVGAQKGDREAVEWLRRAAQDRLRRAPSVAVELIEKALALADDDYDERDELLTELVVASLWGGNPSKAEEVARLVLSRNPDRALVGTLRSSLFRSLLLQGRGFEVVEFQEEELAALDERDRAQVLAEAAYFMAEARHDPVAQRQAASHNVSSWADRERDHPTQREARGEALAREALPLAESVGDEAIQCLSLCALSSILDTRAEFTQALELSRRAVAVAENAHLGTAHRYTPHFNLAMQLLLTDQLDEAEKVVLTGLDRAESTGVISAVPLYQHLLARIHFATGHWEDAVAQWEAAIALGEEIGTKMIVADVAHAFLTQVALYRGDMRAADRHARAVEEGARSQDASGVRSPLSLWPRMLMLEAAGNLDEAVSLATSIHKVARAQRWVAVYRLIGLDVARVATAADAVDLGREVVQAMERLAVGAGADSVRGAARLAHGMVTRHVGSLLEAVDCYARSSLVFERAGCWEWTGRTLIHEGRIDEGADLVGRAAEEYERIGAERLVARADADLRAAKRPRRRSGRRPRRAATGWEALTKTELRVAALAGEAMSNAAIARALHISPRTVHAHMSHIFTKLEIRSRTQLAVEAARREA